MYRTLLLLVAVALPLQAQQSTDSTHFTGDVRFVSSAGNASASTLALGDNFDRLLGSWIFSQDFRMIYGRSSGRDLANFYHAALRAKYGFSHEANVFGYGAWERNTPAGLARRFEEGVGVGYTVLELTRDKVGLEAGPTWVQERRPPLPNRHFTAGRVAGTYDHVFQERTTFQQIFEFLPDMSRLANYQINSHSTLAVPVSGIVGLAVSYDVRYVNEPPAGRYKADRFFAAGLQLTQ